ncbi:hypothetical protein [Nonomuraea roseola]|uniref:Uncharacterized protein n=1 Tax=Nonomuraea roseola TaxID=46179 RepID=A0ABV5PUG1_9ACTN
MTRPATTPRRTRENPATLRTTALRLTSDRPAADPTTTRRRTREKAVSRRAVGGAVSRRTLEESA